MLCRRHDLVGPIADLSTRTRQADKSADAHDTSVPTLG